MPYGSGRVIRHALIYAKPWQRYVISGAMILGGAGLAALGHVGGVLLAGAGALLMWQMLQHRMAPRYGAGRSADSNELGRSDDASESSP
jgi:hypothetical protein